MTVAEAPTVRCPVCGEIAHYAYPHPEAKIYRCATCSHAFTDPASIHGMEKYTPEYYEEAHRNWFAHPNFALFDWIDRQLPPAFGSLVDIGCGQGQFLEFLRDRHPEARLVGVDLSPNSNRKGIEFHCGDALDLALGTFDAAVSLAAIEHVVDANAFAARLSSLVRPAGCAVVMTLDEGSILYRTARLARSLGFALAFDRLYSAHHLQHFTRRSLSKLLTRNNLIIRKTLSHNAPTAAIDVPVRGGPLRPIVLTAMMLLLAAGTITKRSYLQTIVCERGASGS